MRSVSLTVRAFLFSLVPVSVVLICCFGAVNAAVHTQIRRQLRNESLASDDLLDRSNAEWSRRVSSMLSKLTENAGLKAAVGLLAEGRQDSAITTQVRATIEVQLRDLQNSSGFDVVAVADSAGRVIAAVSCPGCANLSPDSSIVLNAGLTHIGSSLFRIETLPIVDGDDVTAILVVGTRFDLRRLVLPGDAALLHSGKIVMSTVRGELKSVLESQAARLCRGDQRSPEAFLGGEEYVATRLQERQLGPDYCLLSIRSLEGPAHDFTRPFATRLLYIGGCGFGMALLGTLFTSRSVSSPLRALVEQLRQMAASGDLSKPLTAGSSVAELALLTDAYNAVASTAERARAQLELAKDEAQSANRLKDEFLINVSHELRTPLNGILGMTQVLLETPLDADQKECASVVRSSGDSLVQIIDDILTFSQLQTGKLTLCKRPFDLDAVLQEAAARIAPRAAEKGITVDINSFAFAPRIFVGDDTCIRQILRHLCDNAVKFTDHGDIKLAWDCTFEGQCAIVTVSVEDTGIGIAPANQQLIFEHFTQADGSLRRRRGGTGLGLALVKSLVSAMHGRVGVESAEGRGSRFWFTVPLEIVPGERENSALPAVEMASQPC